MNLYGVVTFKPLSWLKIVNLFQPFSHTSANFQAIKGLQLDKASILKLKPQNKSNVISILISFDVFKLGLPALLQITIHKISILKVFTTT